MRPPKRPLKREETIPPPPDTRPEGVGAIISPGEPEPGSAEDYYKVIHAHRTVLAMKAVRPDAPTTAMAVVVEDEREGEAPSHAAQVLLQRIFIAEKEAADLRERLTEALHERDAARGEALQLRTAVDAIKAALK